MARIRVSIGAMPLGVEDIEPSVDGSAPYSIDTPVNSVSQVIPIIFWIDEIGKQRVEDLVVPAIDTRVRMSTDGQNWGGWGAGMTLPGPITTQGKAAYLQTRGFPGDVGALAVKLVVDQGYIVDTDEMVLGIFNEGRENIDISDLIKLGMLSGLEAASRNDTAALGYGGAISELPMYTETSRNVDIAILNLVSVIPVVPEQDNAVETAAVRMVGPFPQAADNDYEFDFAYFPIAAPTNLVLTPGDGTITAAWDAVSGATGYECRVNSGTWVDKGTTRTHQFTGLTNGVSATVEVRAYDANGVGAVVSDSETPAAAPLGFLTGSVSWKHDAGLDEEVASRGYGRRQLTGAAYTLHVYTEFGSGSATLRRGSYDIGGTVLGTSQSTSGVSWWRLDLSNEGGDVRIKVDSSSNGTSWTNRINLLDTSEDRIGVSGEWGALYAASNISVTEI